MKIWALGVLLAFGMALQVWGGGRPSCLAKKRISPHIVPEAAVGFPLFQRVNKDQEVAELAAKTAAGAPAERCVPAQVWGIQYKGQTIGQMARSGPDLNGWMHLKVAFMGEDSMALAFQPSIQQMCLSRAIKIWLELGALIVGEEKACFDKTLNASNFTLVKVKGLALDVDESSPLISYLLNGPGRPFEDPRYQKVFKISFMMHPREQADITLPAYEEGEA